MFGLEPAPINIDKSRAPLWPEGYVGSISHSAELCCALVAPRSRMASLGIDIERIVETAAEIAGHAANLKEQAAFEELEAAGYSAPIACLTIKEAFYKAYFPQTSVFLEFADAELGFDVPKGIARASLMRSDAPSLFQKSKRRCQLRPYRRSSNRACCDPLVLVTSGFSSCIGTSSKRL